MGPGQFLRRCCERCSGLACPTESQGVTSKPGGSFRFSSLTGPRLEITWGEPYTAAASTAAVTAAGWAMRRAFSICVAVVACAALWACSDDAATPANALADSTPSTAAGDADGAADTAHDTQAEGPADAATATDADIHDAKYVDSADHADIAADIASDTPADSAADASADSTDAASGIVDLGPGQPFGTLVPGAAGPCVEVAPFQSPDCATVKCSAGAVCVAGGVCAPQAGFYADDAGPADQAWPAVAAREDGAFAVAWSAGSYFGDGLQVKVRLFGAAGQALSATLAVSPAPGPAIAMHYAPSVAAMADGSWLLLWRSELQAQSTAAYFVQQVAADGSALIGTPAQINATPLGIATGSSNIIQPVLVRLRNDRLMAAWVGNPQSGGGPTVWARLINPDGTPLTGELDTGASAAGGPASSPAIGALTGGQALLVWEATLAGKGPQLIRGRVFAEGGVPASAVLDLSPGAKPYEALPAVAGYPNGETLLMFKAGDSVGSTDKVDIRGRKLAATWPQPPKSGVMAGLPKILDTDPTGTYPGAAPAVLLSADRALAVWHNPGQPPYGIWGRRHWREVDAWDCQLLDLGGPQLGGEQGSRVLPAAAAWNNGRVAVVWTAQLSGGTNPSRIAVRLLGL